MISGLSATNVSVANDGLGDFLIAPVYFAKGDITPILEYEEKINNLTPTQLEEMKKYFKNSVTIILKK